MAEEEGFRGVITFLDKIGVYDVILPFLLVFTIVFAVLDKTKILGIDKIGDEEYTKKNLNAIVAFAVALLVVASAQLVGQINEIMSNVVLLLVLAISFLMLVGVFFSDQEFSLEQMENWKKFLMVLMFIGIVIIFLNALDWLKFIFSLIENFNMEWAATVLFFIIVIGFIVWITWSPTNKSKGDKKGKE